MSDSYYELLGVEPDASREEIEIAYRETVKQVHPDKSGDSVSKERFMRVQEARTVLIDPEKRAQYDRRRTTEANTNQEQTQNQRQGQRRQQNQQKQDTQRERRRTDDRQSSSQRSRTQTSHQTTEPSEHRPKHDDRRWRTTDSRGSTQHDSPLMVVWSWIVAVFKNTRQAIRMFLRLVRCPSARSVDRTLLRSLVFSPTGVRIGTTITLVFVLTIAVRSLGYSPRESPTLGLGVVLIGLVGSYSGYDLLSLHSFHDSWIRTRTRNRYTPDSKHRLWPISAMNLLGVGLVVSALAGGAPTGGIVFTGVLLLPFAVPLLFYSGVQPSGIELRRTTTVIRYVFGSVPRSMSVITAGIVVLIVFTQNGIHTPKLLENWAVTASSPWVGNFTLGMVYVGLLLNFLVGIVMYACILWSMYAMCRHLTAAPWIDRYDHGYRVRPGPWNLLVAGPFVVGVWMVLAGVPTIDVPLGLSTLTLSQQGFLTGLFVLPTVLTGLYILRRRIELIFHA